MALRSAIVNVMDKACRKAARGLVRDFGEVEQLQISRKGPADFVTRADLKAEAVLRDALGQARPDAAFLMEESGASGPADAPCRWIVDPLDGTSNYLHGIPHFAISVAFEEAGEVTHGMIYEPIRDEMFWAEKGRGAWLNDSRLRVSGRRELDVALIATGIPFKGLDDHEVFRATLAALMPEVAGIRRFGSAALDLAWVAAGRYDGFWEFGLYPWDVAAGVLIAREAGALVTDISGRVYQLGAPHILAANEPLHGPVGKFLRAAMAG